MLGFPIFLHPDNTFSGTKKYYADELLDFLVFHSLDESLLQIPVCPEEEQQVEKWRIPNSQSMTDSIYLNDYFLPFILNKKSVQGGI